MKAPFSFIISKAREKIKSKLTVSKSRRLFFYKLAKLFDKVFQFLVGSGNAHNGIDVSWAYGLEEYEIEYAAAERLFEFLQDEILLAVDDEWDIEDLCATIDKYNI